MELHELIRMTTLINRLAKRALFAEEQMVALEGQCAEWKRIADELKAERNALRSTTIDTAAGRLLDAFGSLTNEPRNGAPDDEYRDRIVNKIHSIKMERDALRTECDDLRRVFSLVHASLGIKCGDHIGNAIDALKKERDELATRLRQSIGVVKERAALRAECDDLRRVFALVHGSLGIQQGEHIGNAIDALKKERDELATRLRQSIARGDFAEMRLATLAAELETERERHKTTPAPRTHPVKVGESVRRTTEGSIAPIGTLGRVLVVWSDAYQVELRKGFSTMWAFDDCTPCDPPPEASHITPEGKQTAEGALPQPGDVVRLVREPSADTVGDTLKNSLDWPWESRWGCVGDRGEVVESAGTKPGARMVRIMNTGLKVWWPLSCIEVVKGGKS